MTIDERAEKLYQELWDMPTTAPRAQLVAHIALAFIEERKIAFKDEREACAQVCEEGIETANIVKAEGIISVASVMKTLAEKIRARSS